MPPNLLSSAQLGEFGQISNSGWNRENLFSVRTSLDKLAICPIMVGIDPDSLFS